MTQPSFTVVEPSAVLAGGGAAQVVITVKRDGSAVNLTGMSPTCTIRRYVHSEFAGNLLEDIALTLVTPASGICRLDLTDAMLDAMSEIVKRPEQVVRFVAQVKLPSIDYYPDPFWLYVRAVAD